MMLTVLAITIAVIGSSQLIDDNYDAFDGSPIPPSPEEEDFLMMNPVH